MQQNTFTSYEFRVKYKERYKPNFSLVYVFHCLTCRTGVCTGAADPCNNKQTTVNMWNTNIFCFTFHLTWWILLLLLIKGQIHHFSGCSYSLYVTVAAVTVPALHRHHVRFHPENNYATRRQGQTAWLSFCVKHSKLTQSLRAEQSPSKFHKKKEISLKHTVTPRDTDIYRSLSWTLDRTRNVHFGPEILQHSCVLGEMWHDVCREQKQRLTEKTRLNVTYSPEE